MIIVATVIENIRAVCKSKKIPVYKLEADLGFSNGYLNPKRISRIPSDRLADIARYLDVGIDTLVTDVEKPAPTNEDGLDDNQRQLIQLIPSLSDVETFVLLSTAQSLIASRRFRDAE